MSDDRTKQPTPPPSIESAEIRKAFGEQLRAIREKAGYTVDELAYATKIMPTFIVNLEVGDFEKLPGEVFVRGFVKSICKALNVSSDDLLQLIEQAYGMRKERLLVVPESPGASRVRIGSERPEGRFSISFDFVKDMAPLLKSKPAAYAGAVAAGLVVLFAFGTWIASSIRSSDSKITLAPPKHEPVEIHVAAEPVKATQDETHSDEAATDEAKAKEEVTVIAAEPVAPPEAPQIPSEQVVEIKVKDAVNIRINVDKRGWETARYEPDTYTIKFTDDVNLLVFDAAAVDISFNGKPIGSLGSKGRVRRLSFVSQAQPLEEKQNF